MNKVFELQSLNHFTLAINAQKYVLVDFFATWCKPCQEVLSGIDEFAQDVNHILTVYKVDTDKVWEVARDYQIKDLPTFILFENGVEKWRIYDYINNDDLFASLKDAINKTVGVYGKYRVSRVDGKPIDWAFVLEAKDPLALPALKAYRDAADQAGYAGLADELSIKIDELEGNE